MKLIDSHCHLDMIDLSAFDGKMDNLIASCLQELDFLLNVSVNLSSFPQILQTARRADQIQASVGIHPCYDREEETTVAELSKLARENSDKVVAIGECGLDYHMNRGVCPRNEHFLWQRERFRTHIRAAIDLRLPLIIHTRDAIVDTLAIMREEQADKAGGVMHCYVENWEYAKQAMEMNFMISFSGIVSFKNARVVHDVARRVPDNRLLIETDSPYLAPVPYRGKPNQPTYVRHVAQALAELRNTEVDHIIQITHDNYQRLFSGA